MPSQVLKVEDFSGGETDHYVNGPTNRARFMRNFLLTRNRKPVVRDGSELYDDTAGLDQIPAGNQRTSRIKFFQDELFEFSARNGYYRDGTFVTLTGPVDSNPVFGAGTVANHVAIAEWQKHMFLTIDEYSTPRKIFHDGSSWQVRTAGLPALASSPTITPQTGDGASYIYYFVHKYTYTVGTVTYIDRSAPIVVQETNGGDMSGATHFNDISGIPVLANGATECYDTATIQIEIYRTTNGGTVGKLVGSVTNGTTTFLDNVADANLGINIYTTGGRVDNDAPPQSKYVAIANECGWYANCKVGSEEFSNRVYQSIQADPDSVPASFFTEVDEDITGISNVDIYPIVFTKNKTYRIEGVVDAFGRNFNRLRVVSDTVGCVSNNGIVRTVRGLFFPANDGFYYTDGFSLQKLSEHINERYALAVQSDAQAKRISGVQDPLTKRIYWALQEDPTDTENNAIYILDPFWGLSMESSFTSWASGEDMKPTSLEFAEGNLLRADSRGYTFEHKTELFTDLVVDTAAASTSLWETKGIEYDYTSCAYSFGTEVGRKWVTKLLSIFKNLSNISCQALSINDDSAIDKELKEIRFRSNITWGDAEVVWGDSRLIWNFNGLIIADRRFPKRGLRCTYKQVKYIPSNTIIGKSDDYGTATAATATLTVLLDDAAGNDWPEEIVNSMIYFENDDYTQGFTIVARTADTITITDPTNKLVNGSFKWIIRGVRKNERMSLESYSIGYDYFGESHTAYSAGDDGANA